MAAPTAPILGFQGKLYRNSGSYASPTWANIQNVGDVKCTLEADEAEVNLRAGNGYKLAVRGLVKASWEWTSIYDPADTDQSALLSAFDAGTGVEFLILDQAVATAGSYGFRAWCMITKFARQEELSKAMMVDISITPTYRTTNAPIARYTSS